MEWRKASRITQIAQEMYLAIFGGADVSICNTHFLPNVTTHLVFLVGGLVLETRIPLQSCPKQPYSAGVVQYLDLAFLFFSKLHIYS